MIGTNHRIRKLRKPQAKYLQLGKYIYIYLKWKKIKDRANFKKNEIEVWNSDLH